MAGNQPPLPVVAPKVFRCPGCGVSIGVRALGSTVSVACGSCGSVIDAKDENYAILSKAAEKLRVTPAIPIGTKGTLRGETWQVIGFMVRKDASTTYGWFDWREYLLFNPRQGFRWLVESNGHWTFVRTLTERPKGSGARMLHRGTSYVRYEEGSAVVTYVAGEFYWRVKVGETTKVADYIAPPQILSSEIQEGERVWSLGEYVEPSEISKAFALPPFALPIRRGVGVCQPAPEIDKARLQTSWFVAVVAMFLVFGFTCPKTEESAYVEQFAQTPQIVPGQSLAASAVPALSSITSPSFELKRGMSNVEIHLHSAVSNNWLEVEGELVGETNELSEDFEVGVEYYSGYDSDGSWSEGSQNNSTFLSSVPEGRYHLVLKASGAALPYGIEMRRGVWMWSNLFVGLLLVSVFPFFLLLRVRRFELARWSNSDFTPSGNPAPVDSGDDDD